MGLREIGLLLHKIDSSGQQFVNRFIYLTILWKSMLPTDHLNNKHFLVYAVIPLNALEILKDINYFVALNIWTVGTWRPPHFTVPVRGLSIGKGILPDIPIFARPRNPDRSISHLILGVPPRIL